MEIVSQGMKQADELFKNIKNIRKKFSEIIRLTEGQCLNIKMLESKIKYIYQTSSIQSISSMLEVLFKEIKDIEVGIEKIKTERRDIAKRREELIRLARSKGLQVSSPGTMDFIGPFKIQHREEYCLVFFSKFLIGKIWFPIAEQILIFVEKTQKELEEKAIAGWDEFVKNVLIIQDKYSKSEPVLWGKILHEMYPGIKLKKNIILILSYRLSLLISGRAPHGWKVVITPPALAEQREAWSIPRLNRPNEIVRIARLRFVKINESSDI